MRSLVLLALSLIIPAFAAGLTPRGLTATALWIDGLRAQEQTARLLGRDGDAVKFAAKSARVKTPFRKTRFASTRTLQEIGSGHYEFEVNGR